MKLLHKLNPFRGKSIAGLNDDNGDGYTEVPLNPPPRITSSPESVKAVRYISLDDMYLEKATAAYHCPPKPRERRPLRSCPGGTTAATIEDPSESSDFDTLEEFRRQNQRKRLSAILVSPSETPKQTRKAVCFADERESKPYSNANAKALTPRTAILRKYKTPVNPHPNKDTIMYSKYKDCKKRCYDAEVMKNYSESMLKRAYCENNKLIQEITRLKCKNDHLKSRLAQLEARSKYNCNINEYF